MIETGIRVFFAENVNCPGVASPFGAQTRHDGSSRVGEANNGFHAGLDISSPEGTPLLAIADGVVTEKREGGLLAGIQIYFQHSPADTGFPVWLYSKYQHLREPSPLAVGERVRVGQVIGYSGRTGTVGGHYGARGYPHLYLSLYVGADEAFVVGPGGALPVQGRFLDPLAIYTTGPLDNHQLKDLPGPRKLVVAPYKLADGRTVPSDTRVVWPYLCSPW